MARMDDTADRMTAAELMELMDAHHAGTMTRDELADELTRTLLDLRRTLTSGL